jgi:hypothetical protein
MYRPPSLLFIAIAASFASAGCSKTVTSLRALSRPRRRRRDPNRPQRREQDTECASLFLYNHRQRRYDLDHPGQRGSVHL